MPNNREVFVEQREGRYVALENHKVICSESTQAECAASAHRLRPDATIMAERVRDTSGGKHDRWRVLHHSPHVH
jgi:hypothetical protein